MSFIKNYKTLSKAMISVSLSGLLVSCNSVSPCDCWKRSDYKKNQDACNDAAKDVGVAQWQNSVNQCTDYSEELNEKDEYIKKDMVVIPVKSAHGPDNYMWKEVYVK